MSNHRSSAVIVKEPQRRIRIVVVEQLPLTRLGLCACLASQPDCVVVGQCGELQRGIHLTRHLRPDLLLLDMALVAAEQHEAIGRLASGSSILHVVALASPDHKPHVVEALRLGVRGVIFKNAPPDMVVRCVRAVVAGEYWVARAALVELLTGAAPETPPPADTPPDAPADVRQFGLTAREIEIVGLIVEGATNQDISETLSISSCTVKHHLTRIFDKTGVSSRLALSAFATRHRLVPAATAQMTA